MISGTSIQTTLLSNKKEETKDTWINTVINTVINSVIMLSKRSQPRKVTYCIVPFI